LVAFVHITLQTLQLLILIYKQYAVL